MHNLDAMFEVSKARQQELQAIAKTQIVIPFAGSGTTLRQRLGRTIVRFGHWVDDHCPEPLPRPELPTS